MKKTLNEIVNTLVDEWNEEFFYPISVEPELFAFEVAKKVRQLTLQEIVNIAEVIIVDKDNFGNPIWDIDSDKILNLNIEEIQIW